MDNLIYKIKRFFRQLVPLALMGALLYGGYQLYRQGAFRHGIGYAVNSVLRKIPYFGTRFRHYGGYSYSYHRHFHRGHSHRRHRGRHRHRRHH